MKRSGSRMIPVREDFAVEIFGSDALIIRLADMRLFKLNGEALAMFELLLETGCDTAAAIAKAEGQGDILRPEDVKEVQNILFSPSGESADTGPRILTIS